MIHKHLFIVLKQVQLSAGLKWAVMTLIVHAEDSAARFATKTPVSGDQLVLKYVHDPVASAKDNKTLKIAQI